MKTPWHVWVIGVLMLVWFGLGALDYTMSHLRSAAYIAMIPEAVRADMLAYLDGYPIWATSAWATGVWFAVLGALLLLARSRFAVPALMLSHDRLSGELHIYLCARSAIGISDRHRVETLRTGYFRQPACRDFLRATSGQQRRARLE